ncbi:MAG TPA: DUF2510 domain-containing protein [Jatrophihabitantaceae bacterium]
MASPGWYPDPNDLGYQQFYDGHQWTGQRRPAGAEDSPAPPSEPTAPQASAAPQAPAAGPGPETDQTQQNPHGPVPPFQPVPTAQLPPAGGPGQPWVPQQPSWQQQPAPPPGPQQWQQPPGPQWQQQPWAGGPPPQRRSRVPLIIALVVVVVAGLAVGGFFLFKGKSSPAAFTFDGKAIDQPDQPLSKAASTVDSLVASRHGAKSKDTRCYFAVPEKPADKAKASDIDHSAWCGPVLFVDGAADKQYLRFSLNSQDADGGKVQLTPSAQPASNDPEALPAGLNLKRPDKASAPGGNGGLSVPAPPPAAKDSIVTADVGSQPIPAAPAGAAMGTGNGGAAVTKLGPVKRYGTGDTARSAPDGQKLIAFTLAGTEDDAGVPSLASGSLSISVDGHTGHKLPEAVPGQPYVAAVPNSARKVDLVLTGSARQTVSLLNGKPGAGNIKLYARSHREQLLSKSGTITFRYSAEIVLPGGGGGTSQTGTWSVNLARLSYTIPARHAKASGPGQALLYVDMGYTLAGQTDLGFDPSIATFTTNSGHRVRARNIAGVAGKIYNVFDVPADLTSGTLHIAGSYTRKFANANQTYTTTVTPITVAITIPKG